MKRRSLSSNCGAKRPSSSNTEVTPTVSTPVTLPPSAPIETGLGFIKVLFVVAPLLGLLGTVVGMIATFQMITLFGTGDPRMMAGGISTALVTTVLGLVVAIPLTLLHSFLQGKAKALIQVLEEQAAGIIARLAEERA